MHLLTGLAALVSTRKQWRPYWVHLLWTWNVFHYIVFFWWFVWRWSAIQEWQLLLYLFILIYAVIVYLLCAVLFPPGEEITDFRAIYFRNKGSFFSLWILVVLVDVVDTQLKMRYGLSGFGAFHIVVWSTLAAGSFIAARSSSHRFHAIWALAFFTILSFFEYLNFSALRSN